MHATRTMSICAAQGMLCRRPQLMQRAAGVALRVVPKTVDTEEEENNKFFPRKIFSGIQPTGSLHLGNYLGAVHKWSQLQKMREDVTYCIVDMHSITLPQDPVKLRHNIFQMAATMLACGIDPEHSTIFVQSAVKEHTELGWILSCLTTMARLGHLPQYKEKTRMLKEIPLGIFVYPVLQAADIMLHKATHVPVGEDQIQHIQLAQHIAKTFNSRYGTTFPICHAIMDNAEAKRIRSLRDPSKKMSKSDTDPRATINIMDEPEAIVEKLKKAVTDFTSDVTFDPETRPGVSNLVAIYSLITNRMPAKVVEEAKSIDTGAFKLRVADAVVEHLKPIRHKVMHQMQRRNELIYILESGADKARQIAQQTMADVYQKLGLGALNVPLTADVLEEIKLPLANVAPSPPPLALEKKKLKSVEKPIVPKQELRVEKKIEMKIEIKKEGKSDKPIMAMHASTELSKNTMGELKNATTAKLEVAKGNAETHESSGDGCGPDTDGGEKQTKQVKM